MSEQTKAALDAAIAAHVADETGDQTMITGYILHAAHISTESIDNGSTGYFAEYGDHQAFHVCLGLTAQLHQKLKDELYDDDE